MVVVQPVVTLPVMGFRCVPSTTTACVCWRTQEMCPGIDPLFIRFLQSHTTVEPAPRHSDKSQGLPQAGRPDEVVEAAVSPLQPVFLLSHITPSPKRDFRQCPLLAAAAFFSFLIKWHDYYFFSLGLFFIFSFHFRSSTTGSFMDEPDLICPVTCLWPLPPSRRADWDMGPEGGCQMVAGTCFTSLVTLI